MNNCPQCGILLSTENKHFEIGESWTIEILVSFCEPCYYIDPVEVV